MYILSFDEYWIHPGIPKSAYFLEIDHSGYRRNYELYKVVGLHWECIFSTDVKDELKIWMDLNGFKICDKIIVAKNNDNRLDINFEAFKLTRI